ncbi:DUF4055 domain-containing protein [Chromobacterium sp.]|uniref:DUF4055 domain-containing protein n=1 Tax=Chromobacterium sp. TaxID=306190 RepID=UPI0035AEE255
MSDPSKKSQAVKTMAEHDAMIDALIGGTSGMRGAGKALLPPFPLEEDEDFQRRLQASTLLPAYTETVDQMVGRVFAKPLRVESTLPPALLADVDREKRNLHTFAHEAFHQAFHRGVAYVLVDQQRIAEGATLADARSGGVRPYCVLIPRTAVLGWREQGKQLTQFRFLEKVIVNDGAFGEREEEQIKVLEPGKCSIYRNQGGKTGWQRVASFAMGVARIPVVPVYSERTRFMCGAPALLELAHLNVKHWREQSDQDRSVQFARVRMAYVSGVEDESLSIKASADGLIPLPKGGSIGVVQGSAESVTVGQNALTALEEQMNTAGAKLTTQSVLSMSDRQAGEEQAKMISRLAAMGEALEDALDQVLQLIADWSDVQEGGSVQLGVELKDLMSASKVAVKEVLEMQTQGLLSKQSAFEICQTLIPALDEKSWEDEQARIETDAPTL